MIQTYKEIIITLFVSQNLAETFSTFDSRMVCTKKMTIQGVRKWGRGPSEIDEINIVLIRPEFQYDHGAAPYV